MIPVGIIGGRYSLAIHVSASAANVNFHNLFIAAGWNGTVPGDFTVTTDASVLQSSTSTAAASVDTGAFPTGSTLKWINKGFADGRGGDGGYGQNVINNDATAPAGPGQPGGPAVNLQYPITIDNTAGQIRGGGGAGGGGAEGFDNDTGKSGFGTIGTAGSGGGAGRGGGNGGAAGTASGQNENQNGNPGNPSSDAAAGTGGTSAVNPAKGITGGAGGTGGDFGQPGSGGQGTPDGQSQPGAGGAAGHAINTNGHAITWTGGAPVNVVGAIV